MALNYTAKPDTWKLAQKIGKPEKCHETKEDSRMVGNCRQVYPQKPWVCSRLKPGWKQWQTTDRISKSEERMTPVAR
jgi:hypothetical protein